MWDPNPTLDVALEVPRLELGAVHYATAQKLGLGGKGSLVLQTLRALGCPAVGCAPVAGCTGALIRRMAHHQQVPMHYTEVDGETRVAVTIADAEGRTDTNVNGPGPSSSGPEWDAHIGELCALVETIRPAWLFVGGRPPPGNRDAGMLHSLRVASTAAVRVALDVAQPLLASAVAARPAIVKINRREAIGMLGAASTNASVLDLARGIRGAGAGLAIVTDGPDATGAASDDGRAFTVTPPEVALRSAIGCGDCFSAGLLAALCEGSSLPAALASATGVASASAETLLPGAFSPERARELGAAVDVTED